MNRTNEHLRAPTDKTAVFVAPLDIFDISGCLLFDLLSGHKQFNLLPLPRLV
jgi:hypothetical protein